MARRFTVALGRRPRDAPALIDGTVPLEEARRRGDIERAAVADSRCRAAAHRAGALTGVVTLVARRRRIVHFEPEERLASIVMVQASVGAVQRDVGNAVAQAIVR